METISAYLQQNAYPGRGIVLGLAQDGMHSFCAYFIMGRSQNSRNRQFEKTADGIRTIPFDLGKVTDPSLILYHPVRAYAGRLILSNGDQTDTIRTYLERGASLYDALLTRTYEPDAPNFTPRISGVMEQDAQGLRYTLSILRKQQDSTACERAFYPYWPETAGVGHILHTYEKNATPLPPFAGAPIVVELPQGNIDACLQALWESLNEENRIALYIRMQHMETGTVQERIKNRYV